MNYGRDANLEPPGYLRPSLVQLNQLNLQNSPHFLKLVHLVELRRAEGYPVGSKFASLNYGNKLLTHYFRDMLVSDLLLHHIFSYLYLMLNLLCRLDFHWSLFFFALVIPRRSTLTSLSIWRSCISILR